MLPNNQIEVVPVVNEFSVFHATIRVFQKFEEAVIA